MLVKGGDSWTPWSSIETPRFVRGWICWTLTYKHTFHSSVKFLCILLSVCISPHSCIVWNSCSLPSCARCLCFLPVSFVLLDVSAGSSSLPLRTIHVPSALFLPPFFVPSPDFNIFPLVPSFSHPFRPFPCPTCRCHSCRLCSHLLSPSPPQPSNSLTHLSLSLHSLSHSSVSVSRLRTAPAPRGRPSWQASKSWMT